MGRYLNMANNNKANPMKGTSANENYARESMQLFTLGLTELNPDGTPVLDQNNNPIPTYDQTVVTNMAKLYTGWTYPTAPGATARINNPPYFFGQMFAVESEHDTTAKTIFANITIPAGQTAEQDLESLLDAFMAQPTMAPFVSQQLIQHLVTSNPSPQYIARVSSVFQNDGTGVTGKPAGRNLGDSHGSRGARGRRSNRANQPDLRPPARAGAVHAEHSARTERELCRPIARCITTLPSWAKISSMHPACSAIFLRCIAFKTDCWVRSFRSTPRRQPWIGRTSSVRIHTAGSTQAYTGESHAIRRSKPAAPCSLLSYISSIFLHGSMSTALTQAATDAVNAQTTPLAKVQAALYVVLTSSEYQIIH
jgi:hypothetical protein